MPRSEAGSLNANIKEDGLFLLRLESALRGMVAQAMS